MPRTLIQINIRAEKSPLSRRGSGARVEASGYLIGFFGMIHFYQKASWLGASVS